MEQSNFKLFQKNKTDTKNMSIMKQIRFPKKLFHYLAQLWLIYIFYTIYLYDYLFHTAFMI